MVSQSLFTPEEAAVYLGLRQAQLKTIRSLPVIVVGRNDLRYRVQDLDRWIVSRRIVQQVAA